MEPREWYGFHLLTPPVGWASRLASFDLENFARDAWSEHIWNDELKASDRSYLVVVDKPSPIQSVGPIIAVGGISHGPDAELLTIAVAFNARRQRLGERLLAELLDISWSHGAEAVYLEVRAKDEGAQALYRRAGFEPVGLRRRYYSDDDALVMRLAAEFRSQTLT